MKITLYNEPEVDIDLEEVAYRLSNGDIVAAGVFFDQFCNKLIEREKKSGFKDNDLFKHFIASWFEFLPNEYREILKKEVPELPSI